ncbi:MAG: HEAT repeat domain-containing protein [Isosphaerales bacterium]
MKSTFVGALGLVACLAALVSAQGDEPPRTGPETEKRFPRLKVPSGLKATLFACDPLIAYPSAVALGPRPGSILVAVDYLTGLGEEIVRRDEIRLIEDTDGDGYADRSTVYASGLNSIQGLTYHDGTAFVMHAPFLSALRDQDGDGVAETRRELLTGLGLPPESNPERLHCANGIAAGHDGWLYLALGDHGCEVPRPEGDRLVLQGGGILRCRPDGRDLHVFATGLRNIYDVALDEELNVFVRDNENDGGEYKIRLYHSFWGADHGYPYLYAEQPAEALPPLADLGLGSSAGGLCYLETGLPREFRGNLFFCEWGRAVMRCRPKPAGSSFAPLEEIEFASGDAADPYGFKPTDLVVERDGSLIVADWADGQRPKRGRGRIYRITAAEGALVPARSRTPVAGATGWIAQLDSESYHERALAQAALERLEIDGMAALRQAIGGRRLGARGRLHAIWALARAGGPAKIGELLDLARAETDPRIQAQAVRAVADLADPVLLRHRLDAGPGDAELAARLAHLARDRDPRVVREVVIAVGRLGWSAAPNWLHSILKDPDAALAHAAMQTMRRSANWPAILALLDQPDSVPVRALALRAIADRPLPSVVDGLIQRLRGERDPARRRAYADALTRVFKKRGPAPYWGYRPPPRPVNTVAWERTEAIAQALDRVLADPDREVRLAVLRRMHREQVPTRPATLGRWLREEHNPDRVAAILESLSDHPAGQSRDLLWELVADRAHTLTNRLRGLALWAAAPGDASERHLPEGIAALEDGPVLAEALRHAGRRRWLWASSLLIDKLNSPEPVVRAAAVEALAEFRLAGAGKAVRALLRDRDVGVRRAAAAAVGTLGVQSAIELLLELTRDPDPGVRRATLDALRQLREARALPLAVAALSDRETEVTALRCIGELGGPDQVRVVVDHARQHPSAEILPLAVQMLSDWGRRPGLPPARKPELNRALAELQGASGVLIGWQVIGPLPVEAAAALIGRVALPGRAPEPLAGVTSLWRTQLATGTESPLHLGVGRGSKGTATWLALTDLDVPEETAGQFLVSGDGGLRIRLNGHLIHQRDTARALGPASGQLDAILEKGTNRLLVEVVSSRPAEFHVHFRRKSSSIDRERLMRAALTSSGDAVRGRKLFFDTEKSQCLTCHQIGDRGERIGPELTGVGGRFSRIFIVESILEPGRTIAPSFATVMVALKDGRVLAGVRAAETDLTLTLADQQGQKHVLAKSSIEEQRSQSQSTMPDGLEKRFTPAEFIDLIEFLAGQR